MHGVTRSSLLSPSFLLLLSLPPLLNSPLFSAGAGADLTSWIEKLAKPIAERGLRVILCPGRSIVSDAGLLVSRVSLVKKTAVPLPGSGSSSPRRGSLAGIIGSVPSSPISPNAPVNFDYGRTVSLTGREGNNKAKPEQVIKQVAVLDTSVFDFGGLRSLAPTFTPDFRVVPGMVKPKLLPLEHKYDIVGATTEAGDVFSRDYPLAEELVSGESLVVFTDAGAYAFSFAGNYASRNRPAEVLVSFQVYLFSFSPSSLSELFFRLFSLCVCVYFYTLTLLLLVAFTGECEELTACNTEYTKTCRAWHWCDSVLTLIVNCHTKCNRMRNLLHIVSSH